MGTNTDTKKCTKPFGANDLSANQPRITGGTSGKGYGFINVADVPDIFVHYSAIRMDGFRTLKAGRQVAFDLVRTDKGLQAHNVTSAN